VAGDPLGGVQVDDGQPDLDDLADRAGRRLSVPAGRLDVYDVQKCRVSAARPWG